MSVYGALASAPREGKAMFGEKIHFGSDWQGECGDYGYTTRRVNKVTCERCKALTWLERFLCRVIWPALVVGLLAIGGTCL